MTGAAFPRVSVIIVSWNARHLLERFLPGVAATDYPNLEVVVADNGSTDDSAAWIERTLPQVRVIRHGANMGFCGGNNLAIRATDSEYVVLLNNDVEVESGWLRPMVDLAESDPSIGAIQPKLLDHADRGRFEYAGAAGGHLDRFGYPFARGRIFFDLESDDGQYDEPAEVFWATGAALLLRRSALDRVGLLDEAFEFHMEEIDLCWRLRSAGYRVMVEPRSRAFHVGGGSLAQGTSRKTHYNFRNNLLMLYKNLPPRRWRRIFPMRLLLDGLATVRFLLNGEIRNMAAVFRAYADAHRMKTAYSRNTEAAEPSYRRSIIWDYWVRRKRRFSALAREDFRL